MAHKENVYAQVLNNKEILERRKQVVAGLDAKVKHMLEVAPGRAPEKWDRQRILQMDKFCLEHEKRCIMWDDEDGGFYLMVNWDWLANRPRQPTEALDKFNPGWWVNIKELMKKPLIDPGVADDQLAAWIDSSTMAVHQFLGKLGQLRRDPGSGQLVLEDPYWQELQGVPLPKEAEQQGQAAGATCCVG